MAATEDDKLKLSQKIAKHRRSLNDDGSPKKGFSEEAAKAIFRSAVREKWMHCDTKLAFLLSRRKAVKYTGNRKWSHTCDKCLEDFKEADVEVDHDKGNASFEGDTWEQLYGWARSILDNPFKVLNILCKKCHEIKTVCDRLNLNWRDNADWSIAEIEKEYSTLKTLKAGAQKVWLEQRGIPPAGNEEGRLKQIKNYLNKGNNPL